MKKGQYSIMGIIMTFMGLVVFAAFYPTISSLIESIVVIVGEGTLLALVLRLVPIFMVAGILLGPIIYSRPEFQQGGQ